MKTLGLSFGIIALVAATSALAGYPPAGSAQDQRCRQVAESTIFTEPNPENLALVEHGYRIWAKCMRQAGVKVPTKMPPDIKS